MLLIILVLPSTLPIVNLVYWLC